MGTLAPRIAVAPDGTRMPAWQLQSYLQNTYQPNTDFAASANAPIPGLSAPAGTGAGVPGLMPQPPFASAFQPNGQYGLLAQQLAGVGGPNMQIPQQPNPTQTMGLLGPKNRMIGGPGGK